MMVGGQWHRRQGQCRQGRRAPEWAGIVVLVLLIGGSGAVRGADPGRGRLVVNLPQQSRQIDGITLQIALTDLGRDGYVPIEIQATSVAGPFTADRLLEVDLIPVRGSGWPAADTAYHVPVRLAQGTSRTAVEYVVPKYFLGGEFRIVVSQAGRALEGYAATVDSGMHATRGTIDRELNRRLRLAVIRESLPAGDATGGVESTAPPRDLRGLGLLFPSNQEHLRLLAPSGSGASPAGLPTFGHDVNFFDRQTLPRQWLQYETFDVVLAGMPDLQRLRQTDAERFEALRHWVACGGTLWLYGGRNPDRVRQLLGMRPERHADAESRRERLNRAEMVSVRRRAFNPLQMTTPGPSAGSAPSADVATLWQRLRNENHPVAQPFPRDQWEAQVWSQPYLGGLVVAVADEDPFPGSVELWWVVEALTGTRQVAQLRRGLDHRLGSLNYWDWILEEVARPPVYAFLGLMTVFAILAGPVAYLWTSYGRRLHWLYVICPALAVLVTVTLFSYGLLADGLGSKVRLRQMTWIEGSSGQGVRYERSTYFSAFRPAAGLEFPAEAAVYPVTNPIAVEVAYRPSDAQISRRVDVDAQRQRLSGGFIPARDQRQFVSVRPLDAAGQLLWREPRAGEPELQNRLAIDLNETLVFDADGRPWLAPPVAADASVTARAISPDQASTWLRELYLSEQPTRPLGWDPSLRSGLFQGGWAGSPRQRAGSEWISQPWYDPRAVEGLFEARVKQWMLDDGRLPAGWFVSTAALDASGIAIPDARPSGSLHLVLGTLP